MAVIPLAYIDPDGRRTLFLLDNCTVALKSRILASKDIPSALKLKSLGSALLQLRFAGARPSASLATR